MALANLMDLTSISTMGSAGFLIIFAAVNLAALNLAEARTARERGISGMGLAAIACAAALLALITNSTPASALVLVVMVALSFGIEIVFRRVSAGRTGRTDHDI